MLSNQAEFFKDFKRTLSARTSSQFPQDSVQTVVSEGVNCGYKQAVKEIMKLVCPARLNLVKILVSTLVDYYNPERLEPQYEKEQGRIAATLEVVLKYTRGHINDYWREKNLICTNEKRNESAVALFVGKACIDTY